MQRLLFSLATLFIAFSTTPLAWGQRNYGLISPLEANRVGLQRAWHTRVVIDPARGEIAHIRQFVSSTRAYTVFQVSYDGGTVNFSERDFDRYGDPLGMEGAEKMAQQEVKELERRNLEPKLEKHVIPETTLYVTTSRGLVQAIDAETGRTRWVTECGQPGHVMEAPGANEDYVAVVNGSHLFALSATNGEVAWEITTRGAPGAGPAVSERYVFVPMVSGAIESYTLDSYRQPPWIFTAHGRCMVQPVSSSSVVAWPTDQGDLYVAEANSHNVLYRLETNNSIVAPATVLPDSRLLTASLDGYVYCMHELSGALIWRFSTGESISTSPTTIGDAVFVVTDSGSLFRLNGRTGREEWWSSGIFGFAAASAERLYCFGRNGRLVILNQTTGAKIGGMSTETLNIHLVNKQTDRIYVGTRSGVIQCLHEPSQEWPLLHVDLTEKPKPEQAPRQRQAVEAAPAEPPPVDSNPFGGGGGSDPFGGGGSGGSDPFGGGGSGGSDPFGGGSGGSDPFGSGSGSGSGGSTSGSDPFGSDPFN